MGGHSLRQIVVRQRPPTSSNVHINPLSERVSFHARLYSSAKVWPASGRLTWARTWAGGWADGYRDGEDERAAVGAEGEEPQRPGLLRRRRQSLFSDRAERLARLDLPLRDAQAHARHGPR